VLDTLHNEPSPVRAALENRDRDALKSLLADDVTFFGPMVSEPYSGHDAVAGLVSRVAFDVVEDLRFVGEFREGSDEAVRFTGRIGGVDIEGIELVRYDDDGRVAELIELLRPLAAMRAFEATFGGRSPRAEFGSSYAAAEAGTASSAE
jgi:hypothetical protein